MFDLRAEGVNSAALVAFSGVLFVFGAAEYLVI
jgi:hypothetical protein